MRRVLCSTLSTRRAARYLLLAILFAVASCAGPNATPQPAPLPTAPGPLNVSLATDAQSYPALGAELVLTLSNHGQKPVYLPICGPWEVVTPADPERPVQFIACEIDYLGHLIEPGQSWSDRLEVDLEPGTYQARTRAYGDCGVGEPKVISALETYYGEFSSCGTRQESLSAPFDVK